MDCNCKILSRLKSGHLKKSPPNHKMEKGVKFESRFGSLSWIQICKECASISNEIEAGQKRLVLCYYQNETEKKLKGDC